MILSVVCFVFCMSYLYTMFCEFVDIKTQSWCAPGAKSFAGYRNFEDTRDEPDLVWWSDSFATKDSLPVQQSRCRICPEPTILRHHAVTTDDIALVAPMPASSIQYRAI